MTRSRSRTTAALAAVVALTALSGAAPAAHAKAPAKLKLAVTPSAPTTLDELTVTLGPGARFRDGVDYDVSFTVKGPQTRACTRARVAPVDTAASSVAVKLTPAKTSGWCEGNATVALRKLGGFAPVVILHRNVRIARNAKFKPQLLQTAALVHLLPGSTATVTATGRPDRTLGLAGTIAGAIPGQFRLNTPFSVSLSRETLSPLTGENVVSVDPLVPDPICSAPSIHTRAPLAGGSGSSLVFDTKTENATGTLVFAADPTTLAGCAGPATGTTTVALSGKLGLTGFSDFVLTGQVPNITIAPGVVANVAVSLRLSVEILDV